MNLEKKSSASRPLSCQTCFRELPDLERRVGGDGGGFRWSEQTEIVIVAHWDNDGCPIRENCHQ